MSNLDELQTNILNVINDDEFSIDKLKEILAPISLYVETPIFKNNIDQIVSVLTKDRDGNNTFTVEDLKFLSKDIAGITSLLTSLFLIINAIPSINFQYSPGETEEIVFKMLAFIFLVIVPNKTGNKLSVEDRATIVSLVLTIYQFIKDSEIVQELVNKVKNWFKAKGWCQCLSKDTGVLDAKMPKVKSSLLQAMNNSRDKGELLREIKELKSRSTQ